LQNETEKTRRVFGPRLGLGLVAANVFFIYMHVYLFYAFFLVSVVDSFFQVGEPGECRPSIKQKKKNIQQT